ncbi:unnamed protein product [Paramecium primaurelia]|uniref:Transmembrane protein n=1 Tax=Paramecium primaurelia TaxID=5886 RepID=A0A8S1PH50_PARPR|nr:unnamed protein product [Paramecium primaurelia]
MKFSSTIQVSCLQTLHSTKIQAELKSEQAEMTVDTVAILVKSVTTLNPQHYSYFLVVDKAQSIFQYVKAVDNVKQVESVTFNISLQIQREINHQRFLHLLGVQFFITILQFTFSITRFKCTYHSFQRNQLCIELLLKIYISVFRKIDQGIVLTFGMIVMTTFLFVKTNFKNLMEAEIIFLQQI